MKIKNILYVETNVDGTIGGSYFMLLSLIKRINRNKFKPFVLFYQDNTLVPEFKKYAHVLVDERTKKVIFENKFLKVFQKICNFFLFFMPYLLKNAYTIVKYRIDIIHLNNAPDSIDWLISSRILGIKCVAHLRRYWESGFLIDRLIKYYAAIIPVSRAVASQFKEQVRYHRNVIMTHDGIDIQSTIGKQQKKPGDVRKEFGIDKDDILVSVIGNIKPWKGQNVAIEAINNLVAEYSNIKCLIVGNTPDDEASKKYAGNLRNFVETNHIARDILFTGFRSDVVDIINASDMLIHSTVEPDPCDIVVLEGMIFSKPVITSAHGGSLDQIENNITGLLIPPNEPSILAEKIEYLIRNKDSAKKLGMAASEKVKKDFNIELHVDRIEKIYETL